MFQGEVLQLLLLEFVPFVLEILVSLLTSYQICLYLVFPREGELFLLTLWAENTHFLDLLRIFGLLWVDLQPDRVLQLIQVYLEKQPVFLEIL